jgi:hypothetical protein
MGKDFAKGAGKEMEIEEDDDAEEVYAEQGKAEPAATPAPAPAAPAAAATPAGIFLLQHCTHVIEETPMEDEEPGVVKVSAASKAKAAAEKELGTAAYKKREFETALKVLSLHCPR